MGIGKYRSLIVAITLFLLVIATVSVANLFIARDLDQDSIAVNLSGRQRMLSQRIAKTVLLLGQQRSVQIPFETTQQELANAVKLFNSTLEAFKNGGTVEGGAGNPVKLEKAAVGLDAIAQADTLWSQYKQLLLPVVSLDGKTQVRFEDQAMRRLRDFASAENVKILGLMNQLTTALETQATDRAALLRLIQIAALSTALLLFAYIVFFALRNVRKADEAVIAAKAETDNILNTVNDGLFLIDREFTIGNQTSKSLSSIFGVSNLAGQNLLAVLQQLVPEKTLATAKSFLDLLFGERVKEALMGDVNPLKQVEISARDGDRVGSKYLAFQFKRVLTGDKLSHLLVSAADISAEVELKRELEQTRKRNEEQLALLGKMMHVARAREFHRQDQSRAGRNE